MRTLALLLIFLPSLALAQANSSSQQPPTKILVWYDLDTMTVIETVIPDSDREGDTVFSAGGHPVMGSLRSAARVEVAVARINAVGLANALNEVAPGIERTAPQQQSLSMLGDLVEKVLTQAKVRAALARE